MNGWINKRQVCPTACQDITTWSFLSNLQWFQSLDESNSNFQPQILGPNLWFYNLKKMRTSPERVHVEGKPEDRVWPLFLQSHMRHVEQLKGSHPLFQPTNLNQITYWTCMTKKAGSNLTLLWLGSPIELGFFYAIQRIWLNPNKAPLQKFIPKNKCLSPTNWFVDWGPTNGHSIFNIEGEMEWKRGKGRRWVEKEKGLITVCSEQV